MVLEITLFSARTHRNMGTIHIICSNVSSDDSTDWMIYYTRHRNMDVATMCAIMNLQMMILSERLTAHITGTRILSTMCALMSLLPTWPTKCFTACITGIGMSPTMLKFMFILRTLLKKWGKNYDKVNIKKKKNEIESNTRGFSTKSHYLTQINGTCARIWSPHSLRYVT
jgi:hypothetical protein